MSAVPAATRPMSYPSRLVMRSPLPPTRQYVTLNVFALRSAQADTNHRSITRALYLCKFGPKSQCTAAKMSTDVVLALQRKHSDVEVVM